MPLKEEQGSITGNLKNEADRKRNLERIEVRPQSQACKKDSQHERGEERLELKSESITEIRCWRRDQACLMP